MNVEFDFFDDFPLFRIANGYLLTSMPSFGGSATEVKPIEGRMRKIAFYVKKALPNFDGSAASFDAKLRRNSMTSFSFDGEAVEAGGLDFGGSASEACLLFQVHQNQKLPNYFS